MLLEPEAALEFVNIIDQFDETSEGKAYSIESLKEDFAHAQRLLGKAPARPPETTAAAILLDSARRIIGVEGARDMLQRCISTLDLGEKLTFSPDVNLDEDEVFNHLTAGERRFLPIKLQDDGSFVTAVLYREQKDSSGNAPKEDRYLFALRADSGWSPELQSSLKRLNLTAAELNLLENLRSHERMPALANRLGVSSNTIRSQIKSIFSKLGVSTQTELIQFRRDILELSGVVESRMGVAKALLDKKAYPIAPPGQVWPARQSATLKNGRVISFRIFGPADGEPVLVLHGAYSGSMIPDGFYPCAEGVGVRLICPDRPGYGGSSPSNGQTVAEAAGEAAELMARLGYTSYPIISIAIATAFAIECARSNPSVTGLLLSSPHFGSAPIDKANPRLGLIVRHEVMKRAPWVMADAVRIAMQNLTRTSAVQIARELWRGSPKDFEMITATGLDNYFADVALDASHSPIDGPVWELEALAKYQFSLSGLECPISIHYGARDVLTDNESVAALFEDHSKCEIERYDDAGHLCFFSHWQNILVRARTMTSTPTLHNV